MEVASLTKRSGSAHIIIVKSPPSLSIFAVPMLAPVSDTSRMTDLIDHKLR